MTDKHIDTRLAHAGTPPLQRGVGPVPVPVVRGSTLRYADMATRFDYARRRAAGEDVASYGIHGFDTHRALEEAVRALEGGVRAFLSPSGLAAITHVFLATLSAGDHALVSDGVYAPLRHTDRTLLKRLGIAVEYFSPAQQNLAALIRPETKLLYLESPSSLLGEVLDLPALSAIAHARGVAVAVDNTWGAGYLHQPLALGADISLQAATKYIGGHADLMQGVVVAGNDHVAAQLVSAQEALGLTVGADEAALALRGIRTLGVRLERHQRNALEVARFLQGRPEVARVYYPALPEDPGHALWKRDFRGANGLLSFALADEDFARATALVDALELFAIGASWGSYESLALLTAPERLAGHSAWAGSRAPLVRLHVGLEDPADLIADLARGFDRAAAGR
ncbi:cystathionine beta-lyase [Xylophilus sp.]|uniref:cystathionine beta-lyase n=1 Tax=Xylophilus sp. TaxID=2653893 RepID=UPI0013BC665C|nr:cystathionine beta-lyase [Xylophilus sp.]KAF1044774.1 MAG: Cystathionine beta-lyase [Xylophilus sp.]